MIGTAIWRLRTAWEILLGKKIQFQQPKITEKVNLSCIFPGFSEEEEQWLSGLSIEFLFAEFGEQRTNAGGTVFHTGDRLNPSLSSLKKYFPNARYTVYTDFDLKAEGVNIIRKASPFADASHERHGYRTADYFKFVALTESEADFKCVLDSDMHVVSADIIALLHLTRRFGFCVPDNDRQLLRQDMRISFDTQQITDSSRGLGHSYNQSPMTLWKNDERGLLFYQKCTEIMSKDPSRASLVMWKAAWETGYHPYILPKQWCLCTGNEGIGDEVILHVGHPSIKNYYF